MPGGDREQLSLGGLLPPRYFIALDSFSTSKGISATTPLGVNKCLAFTTHKCVLIQLSFSKTVHSRFFLKDTKLWAKPLNVFFQRGVSMGQEHSTPPRTNLLTSKLGCCASHEALTTVTLSYRFRSSARSSKWPIYMYLFIRNFQLGDIFKIFCRDSILADSKIDLRCRKLQVFEPY